MKYTAREAYCSSRWPKIIGSYEAELHESIDQLRERNYDQVWDVGCAEGYYAVGFARLFPSAQVHAFDISEKARKMCHLLAQENELGERVKIEQECRPESFGRLDPKKRNLVFCDCEGYEQNLFTEFNLKQLLNTDVLIELHEHLRNGVRLQLESLFNKTHDLIIIETVSDFKKAWSYKFWPLNPMNILERRYATAERRYVKMYWLVGLAKTDV